MSEMATQPQTCCALCGATHATSLLYRRGNGAWQCRDGEKCKTRRGEVQPAPAAAGAPAAAETAADGPVGAETVCGTCGRKSAFLREGSNCVRRDPDGMRCTGRMLAAAEPIRCARCGSSREGMTPHRRETGVCCKTEETTHPVTTMRQGEEPETVQHPAQVARLAEPSAPAEVMVPIRLVNALQEALREEHRADIELREAQERKWRCGQRTLDIRAEIDVLYAAACREREA
jgi:hypothetical protein